MPPARIRPNSDILTHGPGYDLHQLYLDLAGELPSSPNSERRGSAPHNAQPSTQADSRSSGCDRATLELQQQQPPPPPPPPPPQPSSSYRFPPTAPASINPPHTSPSGSLYLPETPTSSTSHRLPNVARPLVINTPNLDGEGSNLLVPWYRRHLGWVLTIVALFGSMTFMAVILTVFFTTDKKHGGIVKRGFEQLDRPIPDNPVSSGPFVPQVAFWLSWPKGLWARGLPAVVDDGRNRRRPAG